MSILCFLLASKLAVQTNVTFSTISCYFHDMLMGQKNGIEGPNGLLLLLFLMLLLCSSKGAIKMENFSYAWNLSSVHSLITYAGMWVCVDIASGCMSEATISFRAS